MASTKIPLEEWVLVASTKQNLSNLLFLDIYGMQASIVSFPLGAVILAQLALPLNDVVITLGISNLSLNKQAHP